MMNVRYIEEKEWCQSTRREQNSSPTQWMRRARENNQSIHFLRWLWHKDRCCSSYFWYGQWPAIWWIMKRKWKRSFQFTYGNVLHSERSHPRTIWNCPHLFRSMWIQATRRWMSSFLMSRHRHQWNEFFEPSFAPTNRTVGVIRMHVASVGRCMRALKNHPNKTAFCAIPPVEMVTTVSDLFAGKNVITSLLSVLLVWMFVNLYVHARGTTNAAFLSVRVHHVQRITLISVVYADVSIFVIVMAAVSERRWYVPNLMNRMERCATIDVILNTMVSDQFAGSIVHWLNHFLALPVVLPRKPIVMKPWSIWYNP